MDRSVDFSCLFGVYARACICHAQANCLQETLQAAHSQFCAASRMVFLSSPRCCFPGSSSSLSGSSTQILRYDFAQKYPLRTSITGSTERTSLTPSTGGVALNRSGLGPVLYFFATQRDLMFEHCDVPFFVSAQPVLMGFLCRLPVLAHWGLLVHRLPLHVLRLLFRTPPESRQDPTISFFLELPSSDRVQFLHDQCAFTSPTALLKY